MAKFFVTNQKEAFTKVKAIYEESKFKTSFCRDCDSYSIIASHKLCISDNKNTFTRGNDFVVVTGSLIYKDGLNYTGMINIEDVQQERKDCIGQYCAVSKIENRIIIRSDAFGAYQVFYYAKDGVFAVSNRLDEIAKAFPSELSINQMAFFEEMVAHTVLCGESYYNEVKRLQGCEYLEINLDNGDVKVHTIDVPYPFISDDKADMAVSNMADSLKKIAKKIEICFGQPAICQTGGVDARTVLASLISSNMKPILTYGIGNTGATNTHNEDLNIDKILKEKYDLKLEVGSWNTPKLVEKDWKYYADLFGFSYRCYVASKDVMDFYMNTPASLVTTGSDGELYRDEQWVDFASKEFFTVDEYLDEYYLTQEGDITLNEIMKVAPDFRDYMKGKILKLCKKYNLDPQKLHIEDFMYFFIEYTWGADNWVLNLLNQMKYSIFPLADYSVVKYSRVSKDQKKSFKFQLKVINDMCPSILDVPFFSRCEVRSYDKEKMQLGYTAEGKLKRSAVKKYAPRFVIDAYKKVRAQLSGSKIDNSILKECINRHMKQIQPFNDVKENERQFVSYIMVKQLALSCLN